MSSTQEMSDRIVMELKREGKYDEIRRNMMDELMLEGAIPKLQAEVKTNMEKMLDTLAPSTTKELLRRKVRDQLNIGMPPKVEGIARERTQDMRLYEELRVEISNRARTQLGLIEKREEYEVKAAGSSK